MFLRTLGEYLIWCYLIYKIFVWCVKPHFSIFTDIVLQEITKVIQRYSKKQLFPNFLETAETVLLITLTERETERDREREGQTDRRLLEGVYSEAATSGDLLKTLFLKISHHYQENTEVRKGVLRNFEKFTGKHPCQSLYFNKVAGLQLY